MQIPYATVEEVSASLEVASSAYATSLIYKKILASSRGIEDFLNGLRLYPERRTVRFDWPNNSYLPTWRLDLGNNRLISLETLTNGDGTNITTNAILRRADELAEPPYDYLEIDLGSSASFSSGNSFQQSLTVLGLYGNNDTATDTPGALIPSGGITDSATVITLDLTSDGILTPGIGSLLLCGTERLLVTARRMSDTGIDTSSSMLDSQSANSVTVSDGTAFAVEETILIDAERMRIEDIAGNTLIVERAWDGTTLETHDTAASVYALRTFIVSRGVLGSTAAAHSASAAVYVHEYPPLINELCIAETVVMLEQNSSAYARTIGSGGSVRETVGKGLEDLRDKVYAAFQPTSRAGAI